MKVIYQYDPETKLFTGVDIIDDSEEIPANATDVEPIGEDGAGLYDPKWDSEKWVGKTQEEWEEENPDVPEDPTPNEQAITALTLQLSDAQTHIKSLEQAITAIISGGNQ